MGLSSNLARLLPDLQVAVALSASFSWLYHANKVAGGDVACQVGKAYNIFPLASWSFSKT